jgi:hypothetical protein
MIHSFHTVCVLKTNESFIVTVYNARLHVLTEMTLNTIFGYTFLTEKMEAVRSPRTR